MRSSFILPVPKKRTPETGFLRYRMIFLLAVWIAAVFLKFIIQADIAQAQTTTGLQGQAVVDALRKGGYNIYFRHAATD